MTETYFITGATGFIGERLARKLVERGARVRCLARPNSRRETLKELGVEFVEGDLENPEALTTGATGATAVFHLAGVTREMRGADFMRVNRDGAERVAKACLAAAESGTTPILTFVSSLACAGPAPKGYPGDALYDECRLLVETDLPRPISPYGRSKRAAEETLQTYADRLPITAIRPPYVVGAGDRESAPLFRLAKRFGAFVEPGWRDRYFSFVPGDDVANVLIAAVERGERMTRTTLDPLADDPTRCSGAGVYFATAPKPIRFSEFGQMIGRAFGRAKTKVYKIPPLGVAGAGLLCEGAKKALGVRPGMDWNKAIEALRGPWICSGAKATAGLGVAIDEDLTPAIERAARWYEETGRV